MRGWTDGQTRGGAGAVFSAPAVQGLLPPLKTPCFSWEGIKRGRVISTPLWLEEGIFGGGGRPVRCSELPDHRRLCPARHGAGGGSARLRSGSGGVLGWQPGMFLLAPLMRGFAWKPDASHFQSCSRQCRRGGARHGAADRGFLEGPGQITASPHTRLRFPPSKWG